MTSSETSITVNIQQRILTFVTRTNWILLVSISLIGLLAAMVLNIFIGGSGLSMVISVVGVLLFTALTAYDTQHIKNMALTQPAGLDGAVVRKGAIMGALKLYLDFINIFLYLLRLFGRRRR